MAKDKIQREYKVKGISAHPDWWAEVDHVADEMGLGRSGLIRVAVNDFLKGGRVDTESQNGTTVPTYPMR